MRIGIVGLGVVGLSTGVVLAERGHEVVGVDIDQGRVQGLQCRRPPIYEPGLEEALNRNFERMKFSTDYSSLSDAEVIFITVSTPTVDGRIYLGYVFDAARRIREVARGVIAIKSTVVPGTARKVKEITNLKVVSNPEFLREGNALHDTESPDRVVIGSDDKEAGDLIQELWSFTKAPVIRTTTDEAELIKYAANSFLAVKVSFINEIANLCERLNCDVNVIARAIGLDKRISPYFLSAGLGWGGSCFPKDTLAITSFARDVGEKLRIVEAAIEVNQERPFRALKLLKEVMGEVRGKTVCVLGLAFKPNTDDTRESVALKVINLLRQEGARVIAYDPKAKTDVEIVTLDECIARADGVIIATEWDEFRGLEPKLRGKPVVDGRRVLDPAKMGQEFRAIGLGVR